MKSSFTIFASLILIVITVPCSFADNAFYSDDVMEYIKRCDEAIYSYQFNCSMNSRFDHNGADVPDKTTVDGRSFTFAKDGEKRVLSIFGVYKKPEMYIDYNRSHFSKEGIVTHQYGEKAYFDGETTYLESRKSSDDYRSDGGSIHPDNKIYYSKNAYLNGATIYGDTVHDFLNNSDVEYVESDTLSGTACDVFSLVDEANETTVWIAKEKMYRVIKIERKALIKRMIRMDSTTDITLREMNGVFVPTEVDLFASHDNGSTRKTKYEISYDSVNQEVDESYFDIPFEDGLKITDWSSGEMENTIYEK